MNMGNDPDYRFSLANERTFLAWIRTALAFLATSIGIDLLSATHDSVILQHSTWLTPALASVSLIAAIWAFYRWYQTEKIMRLNAQFKYSHSLLTMTMIVVCTATVVGYLSI